MIGRQHGKEGTPSPLLSVISRLVPVMSISIFSSLQAERAQEVRANG